MNLFDPEPEDPSLAPPMTDSPLADRMRPRSLDEVLGQERWIGKDGPLRLALERDQLFSMIFWGPPGCGKTTLARLIATQTRSRFVSYSAVLSGIKEIRAVMAEAERARRSSGRRTVLFIDEIHRFNKAQQDAFLPFVESGDVILIGATTENPSFELNGALLSRTRVLRLEPLSPEEIVTLLRRALQDETRGFGKERFEVKDEALERMAQLSSGDARQALSLLEACARLSRQHGPGTPIDVELLDRVAERVLLYDKSGEEHFNIISALHKSIRSSHVDAALYWLARMLEAGEDPHYVARRLIRIASEDVGLEDPRALGICVAALQAYDVLGLPEGKLALAQAAAYLALVPKSDALYTAYEEAAHDARERFADPVPLHLRNAPTRLMKEEGYGKGYKHAHDDPEGAAEMECMPPSLKGRKYYRGRRR